MFTRKRKGITPVIAIVLLLLVTVGAVGVVWTQFQDLVEDPDTDFLEEIETEIQSVIREDDATYVDEFTDAEDGVSIRVQNTGDETYNFSESVRMEYSLDGEGPLEYESVEPVLGMETVDADAAPYPVCAQDFEANGDHGEDGLFEPGETFTCFTGVEMPSPTQELEIHLVQQSDGAEIDSWECQPATSDSSTC